MTGLPPTQPATDEKPRAEAQGDDGALSAIQKMIRELSLLPTPTEIELRDEEELPEPHDL